MKRFEYPEIEITAFSSENIVTASGNAKGRDLISGSIQSYDAEYSGLQFSK